MLQVSFKSKCLTILLFFILSISIGFGQTAITAANTSYNSATLGFTYNNSGAPGSPLAGNTYTYNYGNLSGTTNNSRQLNSFTAAGNTLSFITIPGQVVKIRRVNNPVVSGTRSLRYSEGNITGTTINIANEYNDDMEVFFNGNINFNSGSDNLFANQGDGNGNNNNIERLDVIFPTGISSRDNTRLGFSIFERGVVNAHDPVKVAVILSVSGTTPTRYSGIINVTAANYGTTNPVADANYVIMRRDPATETVMKASTTSLQGVGGVFLRLSDFGIANNTTIYGYSIIPNDFRGTTSAQIIDYTNASLYPTNTSGATGTGGIDLVSSTGAFQNGNVVNGGISGTVFNDVNGLSNSLVDGTGTNVSGAINAILVNAAGNVVATTIVNNNGTYSFGMIPAGTYTVRISVNAGTIGAAAPAVVLPAGWVNTGEGTTAAGDGTANGITNSFVFNGTSLTNVNFGIEQTPAPANLTAASQVNPGGTVSVTVPAATFSATDPSGGTITSIRISAFPTNATSITINGINYTAATFPVGGITVPANAAGQPTQPITIDPVNGAVTAVITYYATDNAGKESLISGTASVPFHCAIPGLWTGAVNNDWNNPGNWCSLSVPVSTTNVVVPTGATLMPSTSSTVAFNNIEIQNGATVDISNDSVTIGGNITGTGTFTTNAASTLTVAGNGTGSAGILYFTNGSNNLGTLTINQTGTGGSVSIGSPLNIITVLNVSNGTLITNDNITLTSNAAGTASVGPIDCNVASVNGNITVERYVSARRAWRLLGVPVAGNQTIRQAWQENTTDVLQNPYPGYGTHITGGTAANGFDQTLTNNPSIRKYNQALFSFTATPLASTNLPLNNENGYFVLVRGDRSTDLTTNTPAATPTVLRTTGTLRSCIQTYPTIQGICNFIGNPYPSSIDFTKLTRVNIPNRFFLWDPYLNSVGGYQTFDSSNNWVPVPGGGSYGNTPNTIIQSGQAFFVQGTIGSGSLTINEDAKVVGAANNTFFRPSSVQQKIGITLNTVNSTGTVMNDGLLAIFDDAYSAAFDNNDARKMTNVDEIFSLIRENKLLSIEKRPDIATDDTLFIKAYRLKIKNYQLKIQPQQFDGSLLAYLDDAYTQSSTPIDLMQESVYNFTVTADSNSSNSSRFRIVFKPAVVLPIKFVSVSAAVINNDIKVSWTTAAAANVVTYTIESSADGQHYSTAVTVLANNAGTYQWVDVNATAGNHYYRIKATEANGAVYYSNVIFIKTKVKEPLLTVFPNPISGEFFTYKLAYLAAGTYSVKLYDNIGQVLYTDKIVSTGSYISKQIATRVLLSKGVYRLVISNNEILLSQSINYN